MGASRWGTALAIGTSATEDCSKESYTIRWKETSTTSCVSRARCDGALAPALSARCAGSLGEGPARATGSAKCAGSLGESPARGTNSKVVSLGESPARATGSKMGPPRARPAETPYRTCKVSGKSQSSSSSGAAEWLRGFDAPSCLRNLEDRIDVSASTVIAAGSFGEVRLATDSITRQQLAVKVIAMEQDARKEVKILSELDHPNIVKLLDVMIHRNQLPETKRPAPYLCIVMDYVPNSYTIAKLISAVGPVNLDLTFVIMRQLASALGAMHGQGIVHRDVWSENVLLNQGTGSVMLVDFGCAEFFNSGPDSVKCLNLPYMSPEASQRQRQGPGDDAWALGLLLSEMLTGKFIKDRLKCSNKPIHFDTAQMGELLSDAAARDDMPDARLWRACKQLLDYNTSRRLSMTLLSSILDASSAGSGLTTELNKALKQAIEPWVPPPTLSTAAPSATSSVLASSVVSASSGHWQSGASSAPSPCTSLSRVRNVEASPSKTVPSTSSISMSEGSKITTGASIGCTPTRAAAVAARASFAVGQRIKYVSRTNGLLYPGLIVSRTSTSSAASTSTSSTASTLWNILLDCGEKKDIGDDGLWRLSHE